MGNVCDRCGEEIVVSVVGTIIEDGPDYRVVPIPHSETCVPDAAHEAAVAAADEWKDADRHGAYVNKDLPPIIARHMRAYGEAKADHVRNGLYASILRDDGLRLTTLLPWDCKIF